MKHQRQGNLSKTSAIRSPLLPGDREFAHLSTAGDRTIFRVLTPSDIIILVCQVANGLDQLG